MDLAKRRLTAELSGQPELPLKEHDCRNDVLFEHRLFAASNELRKLGSFVNGIPVTTNKEGDETREVLPVQW